MEYKAVYIVDAVRTPHAKAGTDLKGVQVPFLVSYLVRHLVDKIPDDSLVDEVIIGNVGNPMQFPNISRVIALEAGLHKKTSAYTVHRNCASGLEAVSQGMLKIASGISNSIIVGGVESMSQLPLIYSKEMTDIFINLMLAKTLKAKLSSLKRFKLSYLKPIIALEQGLTDPFCGMNMGETAELLATEFNITREEQDIFANNSHKKAISAIKDSKFKPEILPIKVGEKILDNDIGPRDNSSVESLSKLRPYFKPKWGTVTVGNSCPITDGASAMLLASEDIVNKYNLEPIAVIKSIVFTGLEPERMGMGPLLAMDKLSIKTGFDLLNADLFELNEAFAAQVLAVQKALKDKKYARRFSVDKIYGEIPDEKLNVNGGAIALGHPIGSTGCRLLVTLAHSLKNQKKKHGIASLCIGGGQGGACLIEGV